MRKVRDHMLRLICGGERKRAHAYSSVVVYVAFVFSLSSIALGAAQGSGPGGIRAELHVAPHAAVDSVLHVLPPLRAIAEGPDDFDPTLTDFLAVTVCEVEIAGGCTTVREFGPQKHPGGGLDYIKLQHHHYHVNWDIGKSDVGKEFEIWFDVAGLGIGQIACSPHTGRTVPIKFRVANHPRIRARVMRDQGCNATEITIALRNEFGLSKDEIAAILLAEDFGCVEIGEAIVVVFDLDEWQAAQWMKGFGCSARETYDVLMLVFDIQDEIQVERILFAAGYEMEEFIDFTAFGTVEKFAPVLYFDGSHLGLPMSAQVYFETVLDLALAPGDCIKWKTSFDGPCGREGVVSLCGRDDCSCGMHNNTFQTLTDGQVPTYYKVISDIETVDEGRVRIAYWWYYGFQGLCNPLCIPLPFGFCYGGRDGSHHGDWENIQVTTSPDRSKIDYVTYGFHGYWYTRTWNGVPKYGDRPVGYVGKIAHGCYHTDDHSGWMVGTPSHCCEYADYRNEKPGTIWYNANENLVSLRGNSEPWMLADRIASEYEYDGKKYTIIDWQWGPPIEYCVSRFWGSCIDWETTLACGTHPTTDGTNPPLHWGVPSCNGDPEGCGGYKASCPYVGTPDYNQGWPWDSYPPGPVSDGESVAGNVAPTGPGQPDGLSLVLSTPNPCIETRLAGMFSVPAAVDTKLDVYDVRGRLIRSIINRRAEPGVHPFEWNLEKISGTRVAAGIYFLRLETPDRTITRKVVIQR
jgi:hypothetical protein